MTKKFLIDSFRKFVLKKTLVLFKEMTLKEILQQFEESIKYDIKQKKLSKKICCWTVKKRCIKENSGYIYCNGYEGNCKFYEFKKKKVICGSD